MKRELDAVNIINHMCKQDYTENSSSCTLIIGTHTHTHSLSQDGTEVGQWEWSPSPHIPEHPAFRGKSLWSPENPEKWMSGINIRKTCINAQKECLCLLWAYLGLDGIRSQEHRCLRRAVDLFIQDLLLYLQGATGETWQCACGGELWGRLAADAAGCSNEPCHTCLLMIFWQRVWFFKFFSCCWQVGSSALRSYW